MRLTLPFQIIIVITLALAACTGETVTPLISKQAANPDIETLPHITSSQTPEDTVPPPTFAPTATPEPIPYTQYTLTARLDYDLHHLVVDEQVTYYNHAGVPLHDLLLLIEPNRYPGSFSLTGLSREDGQPVTDYTLDGPELFLPLDEPLKPGDSISITLSYELNLPQQNTPFGYTERQTNLSDWYPFVPPYIPGAGWLVREPAYPGEHLAYDVADFQVEVQLARPYSADGSLLTIAASALDEGDQERHRYQLEAARNFAWSVSDQYKVLTTTVGDVQVLGYSFPFHVNADEPALQATADALALFIELYGPYSHESLSVVEADFLNGMEYEGLNYLSHAFYDYFTGTPENNLIIIAAHEVAHQWFFGQVGNDQALEPWLDEALCTYSERLFYEHVYPDLVGWWWDNRVRFHQPEGWVDSTIYTTAGFRPYKDAIYLRGALFLEDLRQLMGDEAFSTFLRDYLEKFTHRQATGNDFFALLAEHTAADISGLLDEYFANR